LSAAYIENSLPVRLLVTAAVGIAVSSTSLELGCPVRARIPHIDPPDLPSFSKTSRARNQGTSVEDDEHSVTRSWCHMQVHQYHAARRQNKLNDNEGFASNLSHQHMFSLPSSFSTADKSNWRGSLLPVPTQSH